jgi:O-antigen ligase
MPSVSAPPPLSPARPRFVEAAGICGLYLFAFGAWLGTALANLGLLAMLLAAVADRAILGPRLKSTPWPWLAVLSALTLAASASLAAFSGAASRAAVFALLQLWCFLLVAWWCGGDTRRVWRALSLALAGFLLGRLLHADALDLASIHRHERTGLGLPILAFGQYAATALLGLCLVAPRLWQATPGAWRPIAAAGWALLTALTLEGLVLSQARAVWAITLALLPLLLWFQWSRATPRQAVAALVLLMGMLAALTFVNRDIVAERILSEADTYRHLLAGDWSRIDYDSVGMRIHAWRQGLDLLAQRPWLGWGPGSASALLQASADPGLRGLSDFHNLYLDLPIAVGLLGSLPFAIGTLLVFRCAARARHAGRLPRDLYLILAGGLALHFLASLTNTRVLNADWAFLWLLLAGIATSPSLHPDARAQR